MSDRMRVRWAALCLVWVGCVAGCLSSGGLPRIPDDVRPNIENEYDRGRYYQKTADALAKAGDADGARTYYNAAIAVFEAFENDQPKGPLRPMAALRRGDCLAATGRDAEALEAYRWVINHIPIGPARLFADERIAALKAKAADKPDTR